MFLLQTTMEVVTVKIVCILLVGVSKQNLPSSAGANGVLVAAVDGLSSKT